MIRVHKRDERNGEWWVDFWYKDATNKRKRFRARAPIQTKKAAHEWGMEQKKRVLGLQQQQPVASTQAEEVQPPAAPTVPTLEEFSKEWERVYVATQCKPSVQASYSDILRLHLVPELGDLRLDEIEARRVQHYVADKADEQLAPKTIKNQLAVLARMLKVAQSWGVVERLPAIAMPRVDLPEWQWLDWDEVERLIEAARTEERLTTMVPVAIYTGLRIGEQIALRWGDIDLARGELHVRRSYAVGSTTSPKSNKHRTIPLGNVALSALREQRAQTYMRSGTGGGLVWADEDGKQLTKQHIRDPFQRALKRAGIRSIRWHDLRHTYASLLAKEGASLQAIQRLLGHSDIRTTMRYAHLAQADLTRAAKLLDTNETPDSGQNEQTRM